MLSDTAFRVGLLLSQRVWRTVRAGLLVLALAATTLIVTSTPASAEPQFWKECARAEVICQNGVEMTSPVGVDCEGLDYAYHLTKVCVRYNGDYVYVRDGRSGESALGLVQVEGGTTKVCRNRHGFTTWARCNFDWAENPKKTVYGGYRENYERIHYTRLWAFSSN